MKILQNKRGIALESAIVFLLMIFGLCALLTTFAMLSHQQARIENSLLLQTVALEQVGEDYLTSLHRETAFTAQYADYAYAVEGNTLTVWRKDDEQKRILLSVEAVFIDGQVQVRKWQRTPLF